MSDIVERLLDYPKFLTAIPPDTLMREAASTITTLQERVKVLEGEFDEITTDLPYVMGWNHGFNHALRETLNMSFPTMLRKMWSGGEVQKWLDERIQVARTALGKRQ